MDQSLTRIQVLGTSGTGKTELARRLSSLLGAPHVELDDLHWLPGWKERSREDLRASVEAVVATDRWIIAGNYEASCQGLILARATAVIWLDYDFGITFWRAAKRTARRIARREECCNGNRESLARALFTRDSILWWVIQTHGRRRREYPQRLALPENAHLRKLVFRRPSETEAWVRGLTP